MVGRWSLFSPLLGICVVCLSYIVHLYVRRKDAFFCMVFNNDDAEMDGGVLQVSLVGEEEQQHRFNIQSVAGLFRFDTNSISSTKIQRNARLEEKLEQLVEDARVMAIEKRIFTETEARKRKIAREHARARWLENSESIYWRQLMQDGTSTYSNVVGKGPEPVLCQRDSDCGGAEGSVPHGICASNRCTCVKAFSGTRCTHSVHVITDKKSPYPLGFGGNPFTNQSEFELFDQCTLVIARHIDDVNTSVRAVFLFNPTQQAHDDEGGPSVCRWTGDHSHDCRQLSLYTQERHDTGKKTRVLTDEFRTFVQHHATAASHDDDDDASSKRHVLNRGAVLLSLNMCTQLSIPHNQLDCDSSDTVLCELLRTHVLP